MRAHGVVAQYKELRLRYLCFIGETRVQVERTGGSEKSSEGKSFISSLQSRDFPSRAAAISLRPAS